MSTRAPAALLFILILAGPAAAQRLPVTVAPDHYDLTFAVDLDRARFEGTETIRVQVAEPTARVVLHALDVELHDVTIGTGAAAQQAAVATNPADGTATLTVPKPLARGAADIH